MFELKSELVKKREAGLYRKRRISESAQGVHGIIDGKPVLSFCSNDYLGLANHPQIKQPILTILIGKWLMFHIP